MLTYKPWQTTQDSAWGEPGNDEICHKMERISENSLC